MRVGILRTGHPSADLGVAVPSYPAMIRLALGPAYTYREFDVTRGDLPEPMSTVDAYVITGSPSGVHDSDPWIGRLKDWLEGVDPAIPLVGICFGHQIMAEAYGGVVEESNSGWASGLHEYKVSFREKWMDDVNSFILPAFNRDQVTRAPPNSRVIATSDFCPHAALSYRDRRSVSFQSHPEFARDFTALAIDVCQRRGTIEIAQADRARASMRQPDDCTRVIGWIRRFLEDAVH